MGIGLEFCDWGQPALPAAAEYLLRTYRRGSVTDMSAVVVVVPGRRAGRRLLELLIEQAEQQSLLLTPPTIETVGRLPERFYLRKRPFASDLVQQLAWSDVLRNMDADRLMPVVPHPPARDETARWRELAGLLQSQHRELAADGLDFEKVAQQGASVEGFDEQLRWQAMRELQQAYLARLDDLGLWDIQTARLFAIKHNECRTGCDIVLVATVDMNVATRQMLEQVSDRVTALVFAPADWSNYFDEYGCLAADSWASVQLPLQTEQVVVAGGPGEQASAAVRCVAGLKGRYRADEITIGVLNEELVPDVERALEQFGVPARWGPGRSLTEAAPCHLLNCVAAFAGGRRFGELASLVRHPDLHDWLIQQGVEHDFLNHVDQYFHDHLQYRLVGAWHEKGKAGRHLAVVRRATDHLMSLLPDTELPLADWTKPILAILHEVYGSRILDGTSAADRMTLTACQRIRDTLLAHLEVPESLQPILQISEAIQLTLDQVGRETVPPPATETAVEMLGWLELPLDDAPVLIVAGFNEGYVPSSLNSDLFLPDALRRRLGLLDNARRYARDAYALAVLLGSRQEIKLILGRRSRDGIPLTPSRLLFATDAETAARRATTFFAPPSQGEVTVVPPGSWSAEREKSGLFVPRPAPLAEPIKKLSITSFRDYLACPYRFYLRHVLRLAVLRDDEDELDGAAFGNLAHEVLRRFSAGPNRDSSDAGEIARALRHDLNRCVDERYGRQALPAVYVQVEHLRIRLNEFARHQAEWVEQGWRIEHAEVPDRNHGPVSFDVDGELMDLAGRIDRIDVHRDTGERAILDYKTSDTARRPEQTHQRRGEWTDLQLPLYRYLAKALGIDAPCRLGYINLPRDITRIEMRIAEWAEDDLCQADEVARDVVRRIRNQEFWPPTEPPPDFSGDYAPICQDGVFEKGP